MGGTPAQACWGYLTKHLTALRDMVQNNNFSNREDFLEKCQDTINYVRFLWCLGNDERDKLTKVVESVSISIADDKGETKTKTETVSSMDVMKYVQTKNELMS